MRSPLFVCTVLLAAAVPAHAESIVTLPAATNPVVVRVTAEPGTTLYTRKFNSVTCRGQLTHKVPDRPAMKLRLTRATSKLTIESNAGAVMLAWPEATRCGGAWADKPLAAGDYDVYILRDDSRGALAARIEIGMGDEPVKLPAAAETTLAGGLEREAWLQVAGPAAGSGQGQCQTGARFSSVPSLLVRRTGGRLDDVDFRLIGAGEGAELSVIGPVERRGVEAFMHREACQHGNRVRGLSELAEIPDGTYAVYVGGLAGPPARPVRILVTAQGTKLDPWSIVAPGEPNQPIRARRLAAHFPMVASWAELLRHANGADAQLSTVLAKLPVEALVFAAADLPKHKVIKDEALIVVDGGDRTDGDVEVIGLDGERMILRTDQVVLAPAGEARFPATVRKSDYELSDIQGLSGAGEQQLEDAYWKQRDRFDACAEKVWDKMVGDLPWTYDLLIVRGTHTTSVRQTAFKRIDKVCGAAKMEKATTEYVAALNAARVARRQAEIRALEARYRSSGAAR